MQTLCSNARPAAILDQICRPMLNAGKEVMVLSASALLPRPDSSTCPGAGRTDHRADRALIGFDAVSAAAEGTISNVQMVTRKPPGGLAGAPYLIANGISLDGLNSALCVFKGSARDAAAAFPANVNVVAARRWPAIGPIAPLDRNLGRSGGDAKLPPDLGRIGLGPASRCRSKTSPRRIRETGRITGVSVIAALRKLTSPLRIGT